MIMLSAIIFVLSVVPLIFFFVFCDQAYGRMFLGHEAKMELAASVMYAPSNGKLEIVQLANGAYVPMFIAE